LIVGGVIPAALAVLVLWVSAFVDGWHYSPTPNSAGFRLARKLGWDTALQYHWDGVNGSWVFASGGGSPDKPIVLSP
jgi:hypothetical protein